MCHCHCHCVLRRFHDLSDSELALLIVGQVKGTAKDPLGILAMVSQVLCDLGPDDGTKVDSTRISYSEASLTNFSNCGGILTSGRLETVLRTTFPQLHDM